jgi:hypothetical protein
MSPAGAVFSHCRFVWLSQTNVPVVLLDPGINRTASLRNVNLTTFAQYAVHTRSLGAHFWTCIVWDYVSSL